ncbi:MAG: methyl-accepting chemotaxis protein [Azospirillaceae bacterium]|nr:methyl-accepting chemotaxis protein [Azospirillaceae bacterium]
MTMSVSLGALNILQKQLLAFACLVALSVVVGAVTWWQLSVVGAGIAAADQTTAVAKANNALVENLLSQESTVRGYLLTGDDRSLQLYHAAQAGYEPALARVRSRTHLTEQLARVDDLDRLAKTWMNDIGAKEVALMADPATRDQVRAMIAGDAGKADIDAIRAKITEMTQFVDGIRAMRDAARNRALHITYAVTAIGVVASAAAAILLGWLLTRNIARPIVRTTGLMRQLAAGDHSIEIPDTTRRDEIGAMAKAVEVFKHNAIDTARLAAQQAADDQMRHQRTETVTTLVHGFEDQAVQILGMVAKSARSLDHTAKSMATIAEQTNRQATASAVASEQTAANVNTVAAAAEEMASTLREIASQVEKSSAVASQAVREAQDTNATVRSLAESAQKIGEVVTLINDIASQTNLLALNATIEAARAGEAGKGFAVVASEVKNLASQTAKATEDIAGQVAAMQQATSGAVEAINHIGTTIGAINEITTAIAGAVEEQTAATGEIARNVQQAAAGTQEVSSTIGQVTETAAKTGSAAQDVLAAAGDLARQSDTLRQEIETFLDGIRVA